MKVIFWVAILALMYSCKRENLIYDKPYFDFDSLVRMQIVKLARTNVKVVKKTTLNAKQDDTSITPDTTQWKHELDSFQQLDVINKPLFKGNYQRKENEDDHSNLMIRSYIAKKESLIKFAVPEVKFFYQDGFKKLKRIESVFREGNVLYTTSRKLTLEFEEQQGVAMISRYHVDGFQKMMLSDTVKFSIEGKLLYP